MSEEKTLYEILTDENDAENIVLLSDDGTETEFEQIATISIEDDLYCILRPINIPDMQLDEDEALVYHLEDDETITPVVDEDLEQLVFEEYRKLCDEE